MDIALGNKEVITVDEEQGNTVFTIQFTAKALNQLYSTNKENVSFKSGCHAHCKAYKDTLVCGITVRILA